MINITGLTKVYKTKGRGLCRALNGIDLVLPDNGLTFILGKSGSGKSTLLNLIGGLDGVTEGKIEVNGNKISSLGERDCCRYRNSQVGFIFQDYHLIDELTVYENVALSLSLRRIDASTSVKDALRRVGLEDCEGRYPSELSGGERQRVAIARAIVKRPCIILADEPTGNLDTATATAITELLKELSRDCLTVIVSHNRNDALRYADRIVELSAGRIVSDVCRNPDFSDGVTVSDEGLIYPDGLPLTSSDVELINRNRQSPLISRSDKYLPYSSPSSAEKKHVKIEKPSISHKNALLLSGKFLKSKVAALAASSFIIAVIMIVMALAQTVISFNAGEVIEAGMKDVSSTSMAVTAITGVELKELLGDNSRNYYVAVTDESISAFNQSGYGGEIREIYNHFLPIAPSSSTHCAGWMGGERLTSVFPNVTLGTVVVDEAFLSEQFGELTYLALAEEQSPSGVFLTDYLADAIFLANTAYSFVDGDYETLLGDYVWLKKGDGIRGYINGVIYTGYKERYKSLIDRFKNDEFKTLNDLTEDKSFLMLSDEIYSSLGFTYSLNPDFRRAYTEDHPCQVVYHYLLSFNGVPFFASSPNLRDGRDAGYRLTGNQVMMNASKYNEVFGTNYTASTLTSFTPHTVMLGQSYFFDPQMKNLLFEGEVEIVGLFSSSSTGSTFYTSTELFTRFAKNTLFTAGLHFNGTERLDKAIALADELEYRQNTLIIDAIQTMTRAVEVFIPIFKLVAVFLCVGVISVLVVFASKTVKSKLHDIGVMKALGMQNGSAFIVFGSQVVLIALLTCLLSTLGYYLLIGLANDVLIKSLIAIAPSRIMMDLEFLTFKPMIALLNCGLTLIFSAAALIVPMIKIKRVKPVQIIKSRE